MTSFVTYVWTWKGRVDPLGLPQIYFSTTPLVLSVIIMSTC